MSASKAKRARQEKRNRPGAKMTASARLAAAVKAFPDSHPWCILCGRPTKFVVVYLPGDPLSVSTPAGKQRFILYPLCEACHDKPGTPEEVEDIITAEYGPHASALADAVLQ